MSVKARFYIFYPQSRELLSQTKQLHGEVWVRPPSLLLMELCSHSLISTDAHLNSKTTFNFIIFTRLLYAFCKYLLVSVLKKSKLEVQVQKYTQNKFYNLRFCMSLFR